MVFKCYVCGTYLSESFNSEIMKTARISVLGPIIFLWKSVYLTQRGICVSCSVVITESSETHVLNHLFSSSVTQSFSHLVI